MKYAVQILYFNASEFILPVIQNCYPHVDKIFVLYSRVPWSAYNPDARGKFTNQSRLKPVLESGYMDKVEVIEGEWDTEEQQREFCRERAVAQGFDFLIVQDADEFYLPRDYQDNIQQMRENPEYEFYQVPWINFWKSTKYALCTREHKGKTNTLFTTCPLFAINLRKPVKFENRRLPKRIGTYMQLPGVCFHLSYVFSDVDMFTKINTWGHSHQVHKNWFKWKWLAWHPGKRNINPINSIEWVRAIPYTGALPAELQNFKNPVHVSIQLTWYDRLQEMSYDAMVLVVYYLKRWRSRIKARRNKALFFL
jgi:hypothetical protein